MLSVGGGDDQQTPAIQLGPCLAMQLTKPSKYSIILMKSELRLQWYGTLSVYLSINTRKSMKLKDMLIDYCCLIDLFKRVTCTTSYKVFILCLSWQKLET